MDYEPIKVGNHSYRSYKDLHKIIPSAFLFVYRNSRKGIFNCLKHFETELKFPPICINLYRLYTELIHFRIWMENVEFGLSNVFAFSKLLF